MFIGSNDYDLFMCRLVLEVNLRFCTRDNPTAFYTFTEVNILENNNN